ncbi:UxaA family hydrolase [Lederbergia citrea]|uniref:UxaA family hydrolase n=1 Tax=Lederbergia citrea TaxID=2833581 RepID=A0A942UTK0_9BACI|nr:UxaA family hydrolase [Lederbergia citrea]MBS4179383.1 UxaA family hydrolase [Lederbergia citrea]MBS4206053.1 UxaA family hydrolase [Lederbergia citrea]MBS4224498.1 UxaA family hydrolase [Lederbergia citrea]
MSERTYQEGITSIVMDEKDNVATLLKDFKKGELLTYTKEGKTFEIALKQDINFGHKVAITNIHPHEEVIKYGEVIGASTIEIQIGEHVHVHNIEGIRGRGDKKEGGKEHANV